MVLGQLLPRCLNSGILAVVGMKAHIDVNVGSGLTHTITTTAANVAELVEGAKLLHGQGEDGVGRHWLHRCRKACAKAWSVMVYPGHVRQYQTDA